MPIQILKLEITPQINRRTKKPMSHPRFFKIDLMFRVAKDPKEKYVGDDIHYFDSLGEFYEISYLNDYKKYLKDIRDAVEKHPGDFMAAMREPNRETLKMGWTHGIGMGTRKGRTIRFSEYFSYSPTTRGILKELRKMQVDPTYSVKCVPEQYLANLLIALSSFWD